MSELRKLARSVARAESYKQGHDTSAFAIEFRRIWRICNGYPEYSHRDSASATRMVKGKRTGYRRQPLLSSIREIARARR